MSAEHISDRYKMTTIAHQDHLFDGPLSKARAQQLIELLDLKPQAQVLDLGCGKADFLCRVLARYQAEGVGVDQIPAALQQARLRAERHGLNLDRQLTLLNQDAQTLTFETDRFDLAICIGASQALGGYLPSLQAFQEWVKPGGLILIGEGYMKQPPDPAYLDFLGANEADAYSHRENIQRAEDLGLISLYSCVSNQDEWDHYEGLYALSVERYLHQHPDDPDGPSLRQRIRRWKQAVQQWGRDTLGMGFYLLLVP